MKTKENLYAEEQGFVTEVSEDGKNEDIISDEEYK